jgi:hypothetical protein
MNQMMVQIIVTNLEYIVYVIFMCVFSRVYIVVLLLRNNKKICSINVSSMQSIYIKIKTRSFYCMNIW